jgi:thiol:disulfide interchange protein DsbD
MQQKNSNSEAVVFLKATIETGWHIYNTTQKDGGPVKTSFVFNPSNEYELLGGVMEPASVTKFEKAFEIDASFFENSVVFKQKVKLLSGKPIIKGTPLRLELRPPQIKSHYANYRVTNCAAGSSIVLPFY